MLVGRTEWERDGSLRLFPPLTFFEGPFWDTQHPLHDLLSCPSPSAPKL